MVGIKFFILHSKNVPSRTENVNKIVALIAASNPANGCQIISDFDLEAINQDAINRYFDLSKIEDEEFSQYSKNIDVKFASSSLKHVRAIEIAKEESANWDNFVVLEDDVVINETSFKNLLNFVTTSFDKQSSYKCCMMGLPSRVPIDENKEITILDAHVQYNPFIPACDSYVFKSSFAEQFLNAIIKLRFIFNIQLSYVFKKILKEPLGMCDCNITIDGSKFGVLLSSLENNVIRPFNNDFNMLLHNLQKPIKTPEELKKIDELFETSSFKNHPAMLHLRSMYFLNDKNDKVMASNLLENACTILQQNGCKLDSNPILKTWASVYKP